MKHSDQDLGLIFRALAFSAHKHKDQRRKDIDASPYINHPIALANLLCNEGGINDPHVLCAALLHDTIEDTKTTPAELAKEFGEAIRNIVMEVTDDKNLSKEERKRLQIEHAAHASTSAKLVKLADKICNLEDIAEHPPSDWNIKRKQDYFDWAKTVVDRIRGNHPDLEAVFDSAYARRPE